MRKLGIPEVLIDIVKSFHKRMEAEIRVGDNMLDAIKVKVTGLWPHGHAALCT